MNHEQVTTRRTWCHRMIYGLWSAILAALAFPAVAYLFSPARKGKEFDWVDAGDLSALEANKPTEVSFQRIKVDGWKVTTGKATAWVVKTPEGELLAFKPLCTHLGCAYHLDTQSGKFLCPCHDSFFSIEGKVLSGPAPRSLDRYDVRVEGSRLWLGGIVRGEEESG